MSLISLAEAMERCREALPPITRTEQTAVTVAHGRVLAEPIASSIAVPSFARATMDGYAVRSVETQAAAPTAPARLRCVAFVQAGGAIQAGLGFGECMEIATGAMLPGGADAVVMVEATKRVADDVLMFQPVAPGQDVAGAGSDIARGARLFTAGTVINPSRLATLAGIGMTAVTVYDRPRVAVLSSGTELCEAGEALGRGQVYNMNSPALAALIEAHGCTAVTLPLVADEETALLDALARAAVCDLVLLSGGSSVGRKDILARLAGREGEVLFHGIALKPGRPTLLTRLAGATVLGLPGNPTSCLVAAQLLVIPVLRWLAHLPPHEPVIRRLPLGRSLDSPRNLHHVVPVRCEGELARPVFKASGDITSLSLADGYIEVPVGTERIVAGALVDVTSL